MSVSEYEHEPVRGLPDQLPDDEQMIWQGAPDFKTMAKRVFHVKTLSFYFAGLIAIHLALQFSKGGTLVDTVLGASWMIALGASAIGILAIMAWAYARSTVYTLTNKRVVLRYGVAMPMMVNLPLPLIISADMRQDADGSGDIVLSVEKRKRLSYMMLWPNVRPWKISPPLPTLRSINNVEEVAAALASVFDNAPAQEQLDRQQRQQHQNQKSDGSKNSSGQARSEMLGAS